MLHFRHCIRWDRPPRAIDPRLKAHDNAHPVLPGSMPSSLSTVVSETSEIEILKRQQDTRLNRNGNRTQRPAYRRIARSPYPLN
jgi:hypothetical protein